VFWQLWKGNVHYEPDRGQFTTWLFAITRSRSLDRLRALGRRPDAAAAADAMASIETASPAGAGVDEPERNIARAERARTVRAALRSLPSEQQSAVELCFFGGLTHEEAAEELQQPLGTVKTRIRLGIDKLRVSLRQALEGES
jgi:RNA polymerase sigma-70 factor (ECF subfamily)